MHDNIVDHIIPASDEFYISPDGNDYIVLPLGGEDRWKIGVNNNTCMLFENTDDGAHVIMSAEFENANKDDLDLPDANWFKTSRDLFAKDIVSYHADYSIRNTDLPRIMNIGYGLIARSLYRMCSTAAEEYDLSGSATVTNKLN